MNWKAVIALSTYGILLSAALGLGFITEENRIFTLGIPLSFSLFIGIKIHKKLFLHGFLIGLFIESTKWLTIYLFFPGYIDQNLPFIKAAGHLWREMVFGGMNIGVWLGFLSWLIADLKLNFMSVGRQIKEKRDFLSIKNIFFIITSLLSFFASICFFAILLPSCAGHPPIRFIGVWIIPISIIGVLGFYLLGKLLLRLCFRYNLPES